MYTLFLKIRFPLMGIGFLSLLAAMWAGLIRLGWSWPVIQPALVAQHGPLMVSGFLGTVIGIERAVALSVSLPNPTLRRIVYIGPVFTALGALILLAGLPGVIGPVFITLGSLGLVFVFGLILRLQLAIFTVTMALGAGLWLTGNILWLLGWPIYTLVWWWSAFLILTIAGERLELSRVLRLSNQIQFLFAEIVLLLVSGLIITLFNLKAGTYLLSGSMLGLAGWLLRYDIARHTVRKTGQTRFMAISLLLGYFWLGISGLLGLYAGVVIAGLWYDALLHSVFIGFVFSMIFGHALIILPAVSGKAVRFHPIYYSHLLLLHLSLLLRVSGDVFTWIPGRQWGGLLNASAIILFVLNTGYGVFSANQPNSK